MVKNCILLNMIKVGKFLVFIMLRMYFLVSYTLSFIHILFSETNPEGNVSFIQFVQNNPQRQAILFVKKLLVTRYTKDKNSSFLHSSMVCGKETT